MQKPLKHNYEFKKAKFLYSYKKTIYMATAMRIGVSLTTLTNTQVINNYFIFENDPSSNGNWIGYIENFKSTEVNVAKIDKKVIEALELKPKKCIALCNK